MTRDRSILAAIAATCAVLIAITLARPGSTRIGERPSDARGLVRWLAQHPADWSGFARLSERIFDEPDADRVGVWRTSYEHASRLAPDRQQSGAAFVRAALFNWQELAPGDRAHVIEVARTMLRDPGTFQRTHESLFAVTGDFDLLLRNNPGTAGAFHELARLALRHDLFAEYRVARDASVARWTREVELASASRPATELFNLIPRPLGDEHERLVRILLSALHQHPLDTTPQRTDLVEDVIDFSIRHALGPLDGLQHVILDEAAASAPARARLAVATGKLGVADEIRTAAATRRPQWNAYHVEKAAAHAKRGELARARAELAQVTEVTPDMLAVAAAIAARERSPDVASFERRLDEYRTPKWEGLCGGDLCISANATVFRREAGTMTLAFTSADDARTYVEVRVNDRRVAEGRADGTPMTIHLTPGVQRIAIAAVNAGNTHTRVRTS